MARATKQITLALTMMASVVSAQSNPPHNVFFGFDFVLHPIAVKWACQGAREQDLATFETLMAEFPEDAQSAELRTHINDMQQIAEGEEGLAKVLGGEVSKEQAERLCGAARPLSVAWLSPEQVVKHDEDGVPTEQRVAWAEFWKVVESLQ